MSKGDIIAAARRHSTAFTLVEMLVSVSVLALLVLFVTQLTNHATAITRTGNKHIDTDTQARSVLNRIGFDLARMIKRSDLDCYVKQPTGYKGHGNGHGYGKKLLTGQQGSDQLAFFAQAPGYYPSGAQSPLSLVAYRIAANPNSPAYLRLERMGKGILWNGVSNDVVSNPNNKNSRRIWYPIVFSPGQIAADAGPWIEPWGPWAAAITNNDTGSLNNDGSQDDDYEIVGPQVFRFEYWYLLKNGNLTDVPWDRGTRPSQTTLTNPTPIGLADVQAIGVAIAVIDPASRSVVPAASLFDLASDLDDFATAPGRGNGGAKKAGDIENKWNTVLQTVASTGQTSSGATSRVPPAAASAIRVYSRYFDLRIP